MNTSMSLGTQGSNGGNVVSFNKGIVYACTLSFNDTGTATPGPVRLQGIKEVQKQAAKVKVVHFPKD